MELNIIPQIRKYLFPGKTLLQDQFNESESTVFGGA